MQVIFFNHEPYQSKSEKSSDLWKPGILLKIKNHIQTIKTSKEMQIHCLHPPFEIKYKFILFFAFYLKGKNKKYINSDLKKIKIFKQIKAKIQRCWR